MKRAAILWVALPMKRLTVTLYLTLAVLLGSAGVSWSAFAAEITNNSKMLGKCEGIYIYAAHVAQIKKNLGLTKNMLFRASRVTTANFMIMEERGKISGKKLSQIKDIQRMMKSKLDAGHANIWTEVSSCDVNTPELVNNIARSGKRLWGETVDLLQQSAFDGMRRKLGI